MRRAIRGAMRTGCFQVLGMGLLVVVGCSESAKGPADEAQGGAGPGTAAPVCEGEPLECDDCPTLAELREGCAEAAATDCGGTMVGPLSSGPNRYTYCYNDQEELIGRIVVDTDVDRRTVEGADCAAEGDLEPLCEDGPRGIIADDSEAIAIGWFNFFEGGYRFERRIDQLSEEQLELARAIRVVPSTGECWSDAIEMSVTVTAGDGQQMFSANEYTGTCGAERTLVDFEAVSALLATVHCRPAKGYMDQRPVADITPDDGCWHGLWNGSGTTPEWRFHIRIPAAGEYRVSLEECRDRSLRLDLLESDGTTLIAGTTGDGACPVLTHTFEAAGSYMVRTTMLSGTSAGDFYLRLDSTNATPDP